MDARLAALGLLLVCRSLSHGAEADEQRQLFVYPHLGVPANPVMGAGVTAKGVHAATGLYLGLEYRYGFGQSSYSDSLGLAALGHDGHSFRLSVGRTDTSWKSDGVIVRFDDSDGWDRMRFTAEDAEITNRRLQMIDWWALPTGKKESEGHNHYLVYKRGRLNTYEGGIESYGEYGYIVSLDLKQIGIWGSFTGSHIEFEKKVPLAGYLVNEVGMGIGFIRRFDRAHSGWVFLWEITWGPALPYVGF